MSKSEMQTRFWGKLMSNIYQNAMDSQSACNLSGIVKQLARDIDVIWEEARAQGLGTEYVNQHPVVRLYIEQMVYLNKSGFIDESGAVPYSVAYDKVRAELLKAANALTS